MVFTIPVADVQSGTGFSPIPLLIRGIIAYRVEVGNAALSQAENILHVEQAVFLAGKEFCRA